MEVTELQAVVQAERDRLIEGFEYEQWANGLWSPVVPHLGAAGKEVWEHMLIVQVIWYRRALNHDELPDLPSDTSAALHMVGTMWIDLIRTSDPTAYVSYTNSKGESYFDLLGDLARHVVNHGTYHRGQLRALAGAAGVEFPETDFTLWKHQQNK